mmetsp:Transcript_43943/g.106548  ORF Transcript_43943/g.106548 Transcript_43943/m.106548 type:complete len:344 (-) Transcript_43943:109-1140(-)
MMMMMTIGSTTSVLLLASVTVLLSSELVVPGHGLAAPKSSSPRVVQTTSLTSQENVGSSSDSAASTASTAPGSTSTRRQFFNTGLVAAAAGLSSSALLQPTPTTEGGRNSWFVANAALTGASDGNLPDLPSEGTRSYLQYRIPLQIAADYYVFSLQDLIADTDQWGDIGQLFRVNNNKGQGQPSRIERDFVNPMRILLLSLPPDVSDDMRTEQFKFEKAMDKIGKATAGYKKDLPVEIDAKSVQAAKDGWEEGRVALNGFFALLNECTGLNELKAIPAAGPNQYKEYGRSARRFNELTKKTKLCQNRGGPALSQAWGQLMVSGYLQDSCGIPDLEDYFYQKKA